MKKLRKEAKWGYIFILVPMGTFIVFTLYPIISAAVISFQRYKPIGSEWIGLENYIHTFKNNLFYKALKNTVVYSVATVPLSMLISFLISIMIIPFRKRIQSAFKAEIGRAHV